MRTLGRLLLAAVIVVAPCGFAIGAARADPDTIWKIVHEQCVPHYQQHGSPAPCALVDLSDGVQNGYALLKDIRGATQFLLIPTERIAGIGGAAILESGATNYFAAAWRARSFVDARAGQRLGRDWVSLAVNSAVGRTQNQLHIHIDCLRADVHEALMRHGDKIGSVWTPFPVLLAGNPYRAIAVTGDDLDAVNPFGLVAQGVEGARPDMRLETIVVVGAVGADGRSGFTILAGHADPDAGDTGSGEQLQDHDSCPPPTEENNP